VVINEVIDKANKHGKRLMIVRPQGTYYLFL